MDQTKCQATKNKRSTEQCPNKKRYGDYCGKHKLTIDVPLDLDPKPVVQSKKIKPKIRIKPKNTDPIPRLVGPESIKNMDQLDQNTILATLSFFRIEPSDNPLGVLRAFYIQNDFENLVATRIQNWWKRCRKSKYSKYAGLGYHERSLCNNDTDFYEFNPVGEIEDRYFFSFVQNGCIYGMDIRSLKCLLDSTEYVRPKNPYNNQEFSDQIIQQYQARLKFLAKFGDSFDYEATELDPKTAYRQKVLELFQIMYRFGYPVDHQWFLDLGFSRLRQFYIDLEDIWNYRLKLTAVQKSNIVGNSKILDQKVYVTLLQRNKQDMEKLKKIILADMEILLTRGATKEDRINGAIYILTALTQVSPIAAENLPVIAYSAGLI